MSLFLDQKVSRVQRDPVCILLLSCDTSLGESLLHWHPLRLNIRVFMTGPLGIAILLLPFQRLGAKMKMIDASESCGGDSKHPFVHQHLFRRMIDRNRETLIFFRMEKMGAWPTQPRICATDKIPLKLLTKFPMLLLAIVSCVASGH